MDTTFYGDAVGHWEGETLVIDSVGFNDLTWQATVDDPDVLQKPWTMNARTAFLNTNPNASFAEGLLCEERDQSHMVTKEHH